MRNRIQFLLIFLFTAPIIFSQKIDIGFRDQHPRVYLNADDVNILNKKVESNHYKDAWQAVKNIDHPFARALESLITENEQMSAKAAIDFLPVLAVCEDGRVPYNDMQIGACIYDWCYDEMSDKLKQDYIREFKRIAGSHSPFYPAQKRKGSIMGHNTEGWILSNQLSAGLAIYDEETEMFDSASDVFFEEFVPARNFLYKSHMHHQGDSYSSVRLVHDLYATWLFHTIGKQVFDSSQQYVPYQLLYNFRPDGQQLRSGDTFDDAGDESGGKSKKVMHKALTLRIAGAIYNDPCLIDMHENYFPLNDFEKLFDFMLLAKEKSTKSIDELSLTKYFSHPMGEMLTRTGWNMGLDSDAAVIQMRIGNYFFGNHQTKDFGIFQIYYKGPLAISSGLYQGTNNTYGGPHWKNYQHQTISKNGLLIFDPNEEIYKGSANDGGQRWPNKGKHANDLDVLLNKDNGYEMAKVTAHDFGPNRITPEYSYIVGDITAAYASKASKITRSMLTINTSDKDFPALFIVFDRMISTQASLKKTWLIHALEEPRINGDRFTIKRTAKEYSGRGKYNGKLSVQTILPKRASITKVGGKEKGFWVEGSQTNYFAEKEDPASEEGAWRIEVSPQIGQEKDLFLHAMAVSDADNPKIPKIEKLNANGHTGVIIENYAVLFNSENKKVNQLQLSLIDNVKAIFIADLSSGVWEIQRDGKVIDKTIVKENSNCLFVENSQSGKYKLKKM